MGVYVIAEAGVNHNGDIEIAKQMILAAKNAGANAVKFQTFKAHESTGTFAEKAKYQKNNDATEESQIDMIRKLELPFEDFAVLKKLCEQNNIDFISTPDGEESLKCLVDLGVKLIKIGSTEVTNHVFLRKIASTGKPIILSTGMSTLGEVEKALNVIYETGNKDVTIMHCTTDYPTDIENVNLRAMKTMADAFKVPVGFSDHTLSSEAAIAAVTLGAMVIEKHFTLSRFMKGPDHAASMEPGELKEYITSIRNTERLLGDGIKRPTPNEVEIMKQTRRSILAARDLKAGTVLSEDMLVFKRPGDGVYPEYADLFIGRTVKRDLKQDEKILWGDV
ncbi:MAG: N-acetylneuraminate synthase [Lachnospiraceae bacterium]|nr:N-acetylneuraminate synthase [Lachnospiraceae bacterium]